MRASSFRDRGAPLLGLALLLGCASSRTDLGDAPGWYSKPPRAEDHLYAAATATSRDMQMAIDKARTQAQTGLAGQLETRLGNLTKQFAEEVGSGEGSELLEQFTSATKAVIDQTLNGAQIDKQKHVQEGPGYRAYVLMTLPVGAANQALMERIRANQNLYTRFQASQAFEELNKELEAYKAEQSAPAHH
ncbi:MAG: hypothetical protein AB1505_04510 [Candidatus Latescibacterota bacterium]